MLHAVQPSARCLECGYHLRGLSEPRCPECGRRFDPGDATTYGPPARPPSFVAALRRRPLVGPTSPGYLRFLALFALAFVLARGTGLGLHVASIERWEEWAGWAPLTLVAALLMALAAAREYLRGVASGRYRAAPERVPVYRRRFRLQAALVAAIIVTLLYPWPALLRFYVSWPWLDAERRAILPGEQRHWPTFVGAYRIMRVAGAADEYVWFQYEESDFGARCGVAFYAREPDLVRVPSGGNRIWVAPGWYLEQW